MLRDALHGMRGEIVKQMQSVGLSDSEAHGRLILALQMANDFERQLWMMVQNGIAAKEQEKFRGKRLD